MLLLAVAELIVGSRFLGNQGTIEEMRPVFVGRTNQTKTQLNLFETAIQENAYSG